MEKLKNIKAIAFDADDTLWALQTISRTWSMSIASCLRNMERKRIFLLLSSRRRVKYG